MHDRILSMLQGTFGVLTNMAKDHDLWNRLLSVVQTGRQLGLFVRVVKVRSHEDPQMYSDVIDRFAIAGNDAAADHLACQARQNLPPQLHRLWSTFAIDVQQRRLAAREIQHLIVRIGSRAISLKRELAAQADSAWDTALGQIPTHDITDRSLYPLRSWTDLPRKHTMQEIAQDLHSWLVKLTSGENQRLHWVAASHMLVHFQLHQGRLGYKFNQATNRWNFVDDHVSKQGFCFRQCSNWLMAAARCFSRYLEIPYISRTRLPDGKCYRCWTPCILLSMSSDDFWALDDAIFSKGATEVRSVKKAFKNFRSFCDAQA